MVSAVARMALQLYHLKVHLRLQRTVLLLILTKFRFSKISICVCFRIVSQSANFTVNPYVYILAYRTNLTRANNFDLDNCHPPRPAVHGERIRITRSGEDMPNTIMIEEGEAKESSVHFSESLDNGGGETEIVVESADPLGRLQEQTSLALTEDSAHHSMLTVTKGEEPIINSFKDHFSLLVPSSKIRYREARSAARVTVEDDSQFVLEETYDSKKGHEISIRKIHDTSEGVRFLRIMYAIGASILACGRCGSLDSARRSSHLPSLSIPFQWLHFGRGFCSSFACKSYCLWCSTWLSKWGPPLTNTPKIGSMLWESSFRWCLSSTGWLVDWS